MEDMFSKGAEWAGEKILDGILYVLKKIGTGIGDIILEGDSIFVLAAIIGIYLTLAGNKKLGTKISSISILSYVLIKVVTSA